MAGLFVQSGSREAFRAALGEPDSVRTETVPNRHDPAITDTVVALYYADLTAIIWKPGYEGARDLLEHVEVRSNRYLRWPSRGSAPVPATSSPRSASRRSSRPRNSSTNAGRRRRRLNRWCSS